MVYSLKLFTGYRSGIYSYATKTIGGYADIDFFDYEKAEWNGGSIVEPDENGYYFHDTFEGKTVKSYSSMERRIKIAQYKCIYSRRGI